MILIKSIKAASRASGKRVGSGVRLSRTHESSSSTSSGLKYANQAARARMQILINIHLYVVALAKYILCKKINSIAKLLFALLFQAKFQMNNYLDSCPERVNDFSYLVDRYNGPAAFCWFSELNFWIWP